jgi:hypothetical protein
LQDYILSSTSLTMALQLILYPQLHEDAVMSDANIACRTLGPMKHAHSTIDPP